MDGLVILTKIEEMDAYSHHALIQFPKYEKFVLCADIRNTIANIVRFTIRAGKRYFKKTTLQDLDIEIEYMRAMIRKSLALKYINLHRYKVWIEHINEIGKMLGGWLKNTK